MADSAKLKKAIGEILDDADLNTITAKKVRQQLEATLKTDLTDRKKEIDAMVMEILEERQNAGEEEEEEAASSEEEQKKPKARGGRKRAGSDDSEDDYAPQKKAKGGRKKKAGSDDDASDEDWGKKSRKSAGRASGGAAKKRGGGGGGTGFTKTLKLSPELSSVMGTGEMARHEVVKKIWSIIKEKNLYDPKNKQFAICNDELLPIFGVKRFRTFGMMKHLKNHFIG